MLGHEISELETAARFPLLDKGVPSGIAHVGPRVHEIFVNISRGQYKDRNRVTEDHVEFAHALSDEANDAMRWNMEHDVAFRIKVADGVQTFDAGWGVVTAEDSTDETKAAFMTKHRVPQGKVFQIKRVNDADDVNEHGGKQRKICLPTIYLGIQWMSLLEARVACLFHALGFDVQIGRDVPITFTMLPGGAPVSKEYTLDLYIPNLEAHIEVKPVQPTDKALLQAEATCTATKQSVYILYGDPRICPCALGDPDATTTEHALGIQGVRFSWSPRLQSVRIEHSVCFMSDTDSERGDYAILAPREGPRDMRVYHRLVKSAYLAVASTVFDR